MWIHKINPSILNDIYKGTECNISLLSLEFSSFGNEIEVAIREMDYNVDKIKLLSRIENNEEKYRHFYKKVIELNKTIDSKTKSSVHKPKKTSL